MLYSNLIFQSPTGKYHCTVYCTTILATDIPTIDYEYFSRLCLEGCKNYNKKWSCPPLSPDYSFFSRGYQYLTLFVLCMEMEQFGHIKNGYLKVKAANVMMKSRIDRYLRTKLEMGRMISTGSCRLCRSCKLNLGCPCAHPEKMAYSFEALGVNVGALTDAVCNHKLLWYSPGKLPLYTSVVAGFLSNYMQKEQEFILEFKNHI